jgi:hypothetical protein
MPAEMLTEVAVANASASCHVPHVCKVTYDLGSHTVLLAVRCVNVHRVTDDLDRRCLTSVLRQFLSPRIVRDEGAALTQSGTYYVPKDGSMESYREYIKALPR